MMNVTISPIIYRTLFDVYNIREPQEGQPFPWYELSDTLINIQDCPYLVRSIGFWHDGYHLTRDTGGRSWRQVYRCNCCTHFKLVFVAPRGTQGRNGISLDLSKSHLHHQADNHQEKYFGSDSRKDPSMLQDCRPILNLMEEAFETNKSNGLLKNAQKILSTMNYDAESLSKSAFSRINLWYHGLYRKQHCY